MVLGVLEPPEERAFGVGEMVPGQATSVIGAYQRSAHRTAEAPAPESHGKFLAGRPEPVWPSGAGDRDRLAERMPENTPTVPPSRPVSRICHPDDDRELESDAAGRFRADPPVVLVASGNSAWRLFIDRQP